MPSFVSAAVVGLALVACSTTVFAPSAADVPGLHRGGRNPIHPSVALHLGALRDEAGRQMGTSFEHYGVSWPSFRLTL